MCDVCNLFFVRFKKKMIFFNGVGGCGLCVELFRFFDLAEVLQVFGN